MAAWAQDIKAKVAANAFIVVNKLLRCNISNYIDTAPTATASCKLSKYYSTARFIERQMTQKLIRKYECAMCF